MAPRGGRRLGSPIGGQFAGWQRPECSGNAPTRAQRGSARLFELDDVFVGMRDVEVAAHQLGREIGIDMVGIEPLDEVLQLVALGLELGDASWRCSSNAMFSPHDSKP